VYATRDRSKRSSRIISNHALVAQTSTSFPPTGKERSSTYNTSVVLEVQVDTVSPAPGLALADDNGGHNLLAELGLSLLDGGHDHVTDTGSGEAVQAGTNTADGNDVQVASTGVVAAVHHGAAVRVKRDR
jgi:hypothetical protein